MRHFDHLPKSVRDVLFYRSPERFDRNSERSVLAHALGATLYVPATRDDLAGSIRRQAAAGAKSMVIDLEDAIADGSVESALAGTSATLRRLKADPPESQLFVRVRTVDHIRALAAELGDAIGVRQRFRTAEILVGPRRGVPAGRVRCT